MNLIVCMKQVPSTNEVQLDPVTNTILRDGRQAVINPFDTFALECAVEIKERQGGKVWALSMGIPAVERLLREAISCGADEGLLLSDRAFAGADTLATARALALGVGKIGTFDLIICGRMATDGDTAQIGPELAQLLEIPHLTHVTEILQVDAKHLLCKRNTDEGQQMVEVTLPALITVAKNCNQPRMASILGVKRSINAPVQVVGAADLGADPALLGLKGSPTQVVRTFVPQRQGECQWITGTPAEQVQSLGQLLGQYQEVQL